MTLLRLDGTEVAQGDGMCSGVGQGAGANAVPELRLGGGEVAHVAQCCGGFVCERGFTEEGDAGRGVGSVGLGEIALGLLECDSGIFPPPGERKGTGVYDSEERPLAGAAWA